MTAMKFTLNKLSRGTHNAVRYGYIAAILILSVFAFMTYRELQIQRRAPVFLPSYWFYVIDLPEKASLVQAHGTWYAEKGAQSGELLQTTKIECRKTKMQCVESTAMVSVAGLGFLESTPMVFDVEQWNETEIVTKPETVKCSSRTITMDLVKKQATSIVALAPNAKECKDAPRTMHLESGVKAHTEAMQKSRP